MTLRWKTLLCALGFLLSTEAPLAAEAPKASHPEEPKPSEEKKEKEKAENPCATPLASNEKAAACIKHKIATEHDGLYNLAHSAGHLGDVGNCSHSAGSGKKSYFSTNKVLFVEALGSIGVVKCKVDGRDPDAYFCTSISNSHKTLACKQGKATTKVAWIIGKTDVKIKTFFPK